jgi:hypothetical protein
MPDDMDPVYCYIIRGLHFHVNRAQVLSEGIR